MNSVPSFPPSPPLCFGASVRGDGDRPVLPHHLHGVHHHHHHRRPPLGAAHYRRLRRKEGRRKEERAEEEEPSMPSHRQSRRRGGGGRYSAHYTSPGLFYTQAPALSSAAIFSGLSSCSCRKQVCVCVQQVLRGKYPLFLPSRVTLQSDKLRLLQS